MKCDPVDCTGVAEEGEKLGRLCWTDERLPACCFYSDHASWDYFTEFELSSNSSGLLVPHTHTHTHNL